MNVSSGTDGKTPGKGTAHF